MKNNEEKKNYKNKVVLIILILLLFIGNIVLAYILIKYDKLKDDNNIIRSEITKIKDDTLNIDNEYNDSSKELDNKKIELKEKIEEYNLWLEMKKKVE